VAPSPETCNGVDDDCDGAIDDGVCASMPYDLAVAPDMATSPPPCADTCNGAVHYVDQTAKYGLWVKVVNCSPKTDRYDLFLGASMAGPFYKIGDLANGGQDHCELVNPTFTLTSEANAASGSCPTCAIDYGGRVVNHPSYFGTSIYYRGYFGDPFLFTSDIPKDAPNADTACWYECGVSF
jgi:hypothetical protein